MITKYFQTSIRHILKNKRFSAINIGGLALGIISTSLILLWIEYTYQYNRILPESDNVYQVKNNQSYGEKIYTMSATMGPLAPVMHNEVSGIKDVCRLWFFGGTFNVSDKNIGFSGVFADSNFFNIFKFPILEQQGINPLENINQIAISKKMAEAFFKGTSPIGKNLTLDKSQNFVIAAVYDQVSTNMSVSPEWVIPISYQFLQDDFKTTWSSWGQCGLRTYATLLPIVNYENVNLQLRELVHKKSGGNINYSVFLYPYSKMGWYNSFENGKEMPNEGQIKYIKLFFIIAVIILLIACINFMNLSTAKSEKRAKEIGLKKAIGISRGELLLQFFIESTLISFFAVFMSVILLIMLTPSFGNLINTPLEFDFFTLSHIIYFISIGLLCGLLAGTYPAFYLSSFKPTEALNKRYAVSFGTNVVRKGLVVFQFTISLMIIIATIVVSNQITHTKNRDLGFVKDHVITLPASASLTSSFDRLKNELINSQQIKDIALSWADMFNMYSNGGGFTWKGYDETKSALITFNGITPNYLKLMNIKMSKGRYFHEDESHEGTNVIINPAMAKLMGEAGIVGGQIFRGNDPAMSIVGITDHFIYNDIYGNPEPMMFFVSDTKEFPDFGKIVIKLSENGQLSTQIPSIQNVVKSIDPNLDFNHTFLDDTFNQQFQGIQFIGNLVLLFGFLSILISCLGLLGLSAYMVQKRTKEIGMRKVLGASVSSIMGSLTYGYLKLILISFSLASPIAYFAMQNWLQNYTYRVEIAWWVFILAGAVSIFITMITVSTQAVSAALMNPVKSLRSE